jgi:hypothetical protein
MHWNKSFRMKRVGAPKVGLEGVGIPARMVVLDVSAKTWDSIFQELSLG